MQKGKIIVIVLDGLGIGAMQDVAKYKKEDYGANTLHQVAKTVSDFKLATLEKLGLMNSANFETSLMKKSNSCIYGQSNLMHYGADTFQGHQEIMGSTPFKPNYRLFYQDIDKIEQKLIAKNYLTKRYKDQGKELLIIENSVTIANNIEAQEGLAYNVSACLDNINFEEVVKIGKIVREETTVSRVITFGGKGIGLQNLLNAKEHKKESFGINAPKSGVYNKGYSVIHLGYGVNYTKQVPYCLANHNIDVCLIGKVADIVYNPKGTSISVVDTNKAFEYTLQSLNKMNKGGFLCLNIQETDLAGHKEDAFDYYKVLQKADTGITKVISTMNSNDILIVIADHGNDPNIGHSEHTREKVPVLVYKKNTPNNVNYIGERNTLADIGKTVADYFNLANKIQHGTSFLSSIIDS